jgi:hypothetical protein
MGPSTPLSVFGQLSLAEIPIQVVSTNNSRKVLDASANISDLTGADPNYI